MVLVALPIWFIIGVLITFSPELGRDMGLATPPQAGRAVLWYYLGLTLGDLTTGYLSQRLNSRKPQPWRNGSMSFSWPRWASAAEMARDSAATFTGKAA